IPHDLTPACSAHLKELARRNFFKITNIDASHLAEYARRYLPPDWKQTGKNLVTWDNNNSQHPPSDWFQEFWRFLNSHFNELSPFTGIPLIPVSPLSGSQTASVAKLQQSTTLIFQKSKQLNLPDRIAQLVNKVGGTVVRGNEWLKHEDLDSYVLCPSPRSVLKVLMNLDFQHLITELTSASHTARNELKDYLSYLDSLSKTEKDFLLKLPLFQTMKGFSVAAQSKQAVLLISGLTVPTELPMPDSIIQCSTETDRRLLQLLKVHLLDTAEAANVLVDSIRKGACSNDETKKTMTWVLQHGKVLFSQNESLKCSCKDLSFIEMNGQLKKASDFFDPRIQTFKVIFESDFFPPPSYTHSLQMLESLTEIGLLNKEMDVSPEHLVHAVTLTDKLCVNSQTEALRRAQVLLEMLESNDLLSKFSHKQIHCLKMLKWIPCEQPGSEKQFTDKSQKYCLFCPKEIRHSVYKDIVGHVMPLTGKLSDRVSNRLGLKDLPPPEKVIENLSVLKSKALEMVNPDTDVDFKRQLHSIYKHMQDNVSVFVTMMSKETCWLWAHNKFVAPQDLVLEYPNNLDLSSYIGKVPSEFLPYRTLFQRFGLRTVLSNEDILGILYSIQETTEARQVPFASSSEVKVSIEILNWLWKEKKTVQDDIPVPVIAEGGKFTLKPRSTALFSLLQDPLVTAYVTVLKALKKMSEDKQLVSYCYHTFWPEREKVTETFKPLVDALYSTIVDDSVGPELFSDGEQWFSMNNAIFLHESIENDEKIGDLAVQVCKEYAKGPNHVVPLPLWLRNSFKQAGLEKVLQNRTWNWEKFYREAVFSNLTTMDSKSRDILVLHAIDLHIKEIDSLLLCYACIPTKGGQLQQVRKLVNPSGKVACLFEPKEGRLIGGSENDFRSPKRIQRLLELGMANDHLPLEDITEKAGTINKTWSIDKNKAFVDLKCLFELMKNHIYDEDSHHWKTLRTTAFLPAYLPGDAKMEGNVTLKRPTDVFSDKCSLLVNMTQPVLDNSNLKIHHSDPVLQILGVNSTPKPEVVLQQLHEGSKQAHSIDRSMLYKIAFECYKFLDKWIRDSGNTSYISQQASSFPFILIGDTFVNVDRVAENGQSEAKPYLHVLPAAFTSFRNLWTCIGVENQFTITQFLTVLQELKAQHGNQPLPKSDLSVVFTILNKGIFEAKVKIMHDCLIPNEHGVLQFASELFYNDSPWMPLTSGVTLCHENIPRAMARHLGIKTTRHHSLETHTFDDMSPLAFDFEQQEHLTVRIKNIISAYPSKKDILKELIQNADDAEATEIHFIWDKRQHGQEKTFGEKWNNLQGPALCVFNNKVFSDADIKGIQQLGEGGKHNTPGTIGKYGVGFNSVYHLTDCPSILTGDEVLCISDPNQKYIENHSNNQRYGIGYKLADTFKEMYVDVYKSFLPDKFSLKEGTMFRLPLRMGTNANTSKISQQGVTDRDMKELCSALSEDPEGLILFLKNICKIKVHEINKDSQELKTIFEVEKNLPQRSRDEKDAFVKHLQNALKSDKTPPHKTFYETVISTSDKRQSKWIVAEQFGSFKDSFELKLSDKLPQASLAARVNTKGSSVMDFKGEAFCSLPLPGKTGLPVHVNVNFEVDSARRSLWKEDGKSKKSNWNEILKQNVIAPLYADLLHYIRCSIAVKKVSVASTDSCFSTEYLCFWPTVSKDVCSDWHEMIHGVYRSLKEKGLDVIPVMKSYTWKIADKKIKEYSIYWCNVSETDSIKSPYLTTLGNFNLNNILEDLEMKLIPYSTYMQRIWKSFTDAGVEVKEVSPSTVQTFLRAKPLNDPTQTDEDLPLPVSATLIKDEKRCSELLSFCLKDFTSEKVTQDNSNLLDGLPLLLTRDKVLTVFNSQSPKWISGYEDLFFHYENKFADYQTNKDHIELLQNLKLIQKMTLPCSEKYLKPLIQLLLENCYVDPHSGLHVSNEKMLKWLKSLWRFIMSEIKAPTSRDDESSLTLSDVRKTFSDCYILPVVCPRLKNKHLLQTMKHMSSVVFASQKHKAISGILFKLGFMTSDHVFFSEMGRQVHSCLHHELLNVDDQSSVLDQVYNINCSEFSHLSNDDMKEFQMFLQSGLSKSKDNQEYVRKLKSLPIFKTTHGERVRIDGPKKVFILNIKYTFIFPDLFNLPTSNSIFLKFNSENYTLSETLNIQVLDDLEYFMKFILPAVHQLTETQILHSLKLLLSLHYSSEDKKTIISSLNMVKLIRSSQGRLEPASYYFDESVELYKRMLPQERFVPEIFWTELCEGDDYTTEKAKQLVREFGMKHVVSNDEIIHFAYQLESEAKGKGRIEDLKLKSSLLFSEALNNACDSKDNKERLLESIADIEFIFPVLIRKELSNYHQPFAAEGTAVKIRGSLIDKNPEHQDLIWTSMPIIDLPFMSQSLQKMIKNAGAHEEPPPNCVASNIRNICQSPCETDQLIKTRAEVFRSSYAYLQTKRFEGNQLSGLPVVLVEKDTKLMRPDDVCLSLSYDLDFRPYLYKITPEDAMYAPFFQKVGVKKKATAEQYCNVLAAVYADSCDKQNLHLNQLRTVKRAVEQLFKLIKTHRNQTLLENVETLYLPAVDGKLYPSSTLCYNDTVFETKRLEEALENKFLLLEKLSECHLGNDKYDHHQLLQLLPQKFQPKMLSEFTEERVVESKMQPCELGTGCEFSGWFDKHLSSGAFKYGLICLIRENSQGKITQEDATKMCEKTVGSIQILCCKTLETALWLDKQPLPKTDEETDVSVERGQQGCTFYLKHNDDMALKVINEVIMTLTKEINALLGNRIASVHLPVLGQLLMCDDLQDVRKTLAKNQIRDSAETENSSFSPAAPGTEIPGEWHDCLDMNVLNNIEEGEYVGYSIDDKYIYAVIVEELPGHNGRYSWRYKVDIGEDEPIEVSCVDLFQFKREKKVKTERRKCMEPEPQKKMLKPEENTCMELEPLTGAVPHSSESSTSSLPASVEEAKREIDKCLAEIWKLPEEERHKAIKRLYLRWHPDKNLDCESLANEAFKYLQNRIDELSKAKAAGLTFSSRNTNFRGFYQQWNQEARYHRNSRERFSRGYRGFHSYNFWTHNENVPRPDREEARRWCRQARCDLNAAHKDTGGGSTEWCLFKVHQAVEKSLIAACYKRNGQHPNSSSISTTAAQVSRYSPQLRDLPEIVKNLQTLGVDPKRTQYPNCHPYPHIPNGQFRSENEMLALNKASDKI
uniref:HEPN domain-containing protein n=1 Tax=Oreochromis aureus TaxID=47969 RepID=A0AAZ1Y352_OREAU